MSNVQYDCPDENCGSRLFAAPSREGKGGKSPLKCRQHDLNYIQTEDYVGPNFEYIDPSKGKSSKQQTHVQTGDVSNVKVVHRVPEKANPTDEELLTFYQDRYRALFNEEPDKRWRHARLKTLVMAEETRLEDKTKAEFAVKKAQEDDDDE